MKNSISQLSNYSISTNQMSLLTGGTDNGSGTYAGTANGDLQGHGTHCAGIASAPIGG